MRTEVDLSSITSRELAVVITQMSTEDAPGLAGILAGLRNEQALREKGGHIGALTIPLRGEDKTQGAERDRTALMIWLTCARRRYMGNGLEGAAALWRDLLTACADDRDRIKQARHVYAKLEGTAPAITRGAP